MRDDEPRPVRRPSKRLLVVIAVEFIAIALFNLAKHHYGAVVSSLLMFPLLAYWGTRPDAYYEWMRRRHRSGLGRASFVLGAIAIAIAFRGAFRALPWLVIFSLIALDRAEFRRDTSKDDPAPA